MPTPIPQEIIDLIVNEVDGIESLKSCSLVSTRFRGASQRILLSSLTLSRTWNHGEVACTLIIDSPHTAPYIKKITLHLPSWLPNGPAAARRLREAFNRLTDVRQLTIEGNMVSWKSVYPLASAILDFIRQRELKKLHIRCVKSLPGPVLAALVTSSPVVSLTSVTPPSEPDDLVGGVEAQGDNLPVSKLKQLRVENSEDACGVLATPEFAVCLTPLRRLGLKQAPANSSLISAVSAHLEHIYFELPINSIYASLPPLPRLRTIHLVLDWGSSGHKQCLINTIAAILLSCPAIRDIIFTYKIHSHSRKFKPPYLRPIVVSTLRSLDACNPPPHLHWRLNSRRIEQYLPDFVEYMQRELSILHEKGRLTVEREDPDEWSSL